MQLKSIKYLVVGASLIMGLFQFSALAQSQSLFGATKRFAYQNCPDYECFDIDWRLAPLSKISQLSAGLTSKEGLTPLHMAVRYCAPPAILYALVEQGEEPNLIDPLTDLSPLGSAILVCQASSVRALLELGASPLAKEFNGGNMLHLALRNNRQRFIPLLLEHNVEVDSVDDDGFTPLQIATYQRDFDSVIAFLKRGANPNVEFEEGITLGHLAIQEGEVKLLEILQRAGVDLTKRDQYGRTPLHYAVIEGLTPRVAAVFDVMDVPTDTYDDEGLSPLHYAAARSSPDELAALLALGANPELRDLQGDTPLIYALRYNPEVKVVTALLRMGAKPNRLSAAGLSPLQLAAAIRDDRTLDELIAAGADINFVDRQGRTLLHHAVIAGNSNLVVRLVDSGFDVDVSDKSGNNSLELAKIHDLQGPGGDLLRQIAIDRKTAQELEIQSQLAARRQELELEVLRRKQARGQLEKNKQKTLTPQLSGKSAKYMRNQLKVLVGKLTSNRRKQELLKSNKIKQQQLKRDEKRLNDAIGRFEKELAK